MTDMILDIEFTHPGRSPGDEITREAVFAASEALTACGVSVASAHLRNMQACEQRAAQDEVWAAAERRALAHLGEMGDYATLVARG